jgi:hypothetical protein
MQLSAYTFPPERVSGFVDPMMGKENDDHGMEGTEPQLTCRCRRPLLSSGDQETKQAIMQH